MQLEKIEKVVIVAQEESKKQDFKEEKAQKTQENSLQKQNQTTPEKSSFERNALGSRIDFLERVIHILLIVKASVEKEWKSKFELEILDMLSLKAVDEDSFTNKNLQEFMMDFQEKIAENGLKSLTEFSLNLKG